MGKMYVNILHRLTFTVEEKANFEAICYQQDAAHHAGLKTTILISGNVLKSDETMNYVKEQEKAYGDEIGVSFHTIGFLMEKYQFREKMFYLLPFDMKKEIINSIFEEFYQVMGYYPKAIAAYIMDARTLNYINKNYPTVKAAVTSCFEEGTKMFYGNQNQWYLFSDGGPWGAYYPSKTNSLSRAFNKEDYCGIIGLPHLNRDMIMAITSRDDLFSSHPTNVIRAKAYDLEKMECPYMFRFVDQWLEQLKYNQDVYYNVFVSASWLTDNTMLEEDGDFSKELYTQNMDYLALKKKQSLVQDMTMSEYANYHEINISIKTPEVNKWQDLICGSKREMYWYHDPFFRLTLDGNIGGAICDLRPHVGRLIRNLGPDTPNLQNMNYPFLLSCEYRGGVHEGSIHTLKIRVNGVEACIALTRTQIEPGIDKNGNCYAHFKPGIVRVKEIKIEFESIYTFLGNGEIQIQRRLLSCSDPDAEVTFCEYHCGCYGDNTYPQDMRSLNLYTDNNQMNYQYSARELIQKESGIIGAIIPELNVDVSLKYWDKEVEGKVKEGWLFRPFYWLEASKVLSVGEELKTCLKIRQVD